MESNGMILCHADGREVKKGDEIMDFRGDKDIVGDVRWTGEGKAGYVYPERGGQYYVTVYNLKWRKA